VTSFCRNPWRYPRDANFQSLTFLRNQFGKMIYNSQIWQIVTGFARNSSHPLVAAQFVNVIRFGAGQLCFKNCDGVFGEPITVLLAAANPSQPTWLQPTHQILTKTKGPLEKFGIMLLYDRLCKFNLHFLPDPKPYTHHIKESCCSILAKLLVFLRRAKSKVKGSRHVC